MNNEIKYEKTPIEGIGRCGMCKNVTFCCNQLGISKAIDKECKFNPSQFKPRQGFKHNEDCYFYHRGDRYSSELCCWDANEGFNCITCNKFIRKDETNKVIRNYILERNKED